ncbi:hypothetical protein HNQ50_003026 [Silvimonas terrae]|uniref:Uncharacterized protein n=1 Tax=Silvimonas terrae TaxID=300266 RepID=A0A840RG24_9NEIS|nr:hypothetical protein [Silvimonas terrae]MBB5192285.1 hypothetical protein [Silvimonas terrae]
MTVARTRAGKASSLDKAGPQRLSAEALKQLIEPLRRQMGMVVDGLGTLN